MTSNNSLISRLAARFCRADQGIAAVEFALIAPILLVLYLGSIDVSQGISADRKLSLVAGTLGDLVAQTQDTLGLSMLNDYFAASEAIMMPFEGSQTAMALTIVHVDSGGVARVRSARGVNGATPLDVNTVYPLPAEIANLARNGYVVASEAWYSYRPIIGYVITTEIPLYKQFFHIPRFGDEIAIDINS